MLMPVSIHRHFCYNIFSRILVPVEINENNRGIMTMNEGYKTVRIDEHTWRVEDGGVRFFVLEGTESALMIDTGMNTPNAKEIAESLTSLPLKLINTHGDPDHVSGNEAFDEFYMSAVEADNYHSFHQKGKIIDIPDGTVIDLGNRPMKVISLPGHTKGSVAILDVNARVLFGGDSIQDGNIYMMGEKRDFPSYVSSLSDLWKNHRDEFDTVYPSHSSIPVSPDIIPKLIEASSAIKNNDVEGTPTDWFGRKITRYDFGFAAFLGDAK